jgi:L,D-transpeptidase YcbB
VYKSLIASKFNHKKQSKFTVMNIDFCCKNYTCGILFFVVLLCTISCNNNSNNTSQPTEIIKNIFSKDIINITAVEENIAKIILLDSNAFVFEKDSIKNIKDVKDLYAANSNKAIWISGDGVTKNSIAMLNNIIALQEDGMNTNKFYTTVLQNWQQQIIQKKCTDSIATLYEIGMSIACIKATKAIVKGQYQAKQFNDDWFNKNDSAFVVSNAISKSIQSDSLAYLFTDLLPKIPEYKALKNKLKMLLELEKKGTWETITGLSDSLPIGLKNENIIKLRQRLQAEIGLPKNIESNTMDADLQAAINYFQYLHDLKLTGKLDTATTKRLNQTLASKIKMIKSNLERIRWIPQQINQPYIWVNVPKMELEYINNDSTQFKMRVVVGRTSRPTPTLNAVMSNVVINPGWNVPPTIMEEEIVPGIARRGGSYLSRRGLKAFYHGREVDASRINSKNYKAYSIQQKPGLNSALGAVKFNLPNPHAIYLHDTPHREDFVKYYRASSSGCIRVSKPRDFAAFVINDSSYSKQNIDSMIRKKVTKEVPLKQKVDVHIVYLTNGIDSLGNVLYLRDIYNKDAAMQELWK